MSTLLEFRDLRTSFYTEAGVVRAVDGVSFSIAHGQVVGVVGESGCGKSVTALSVLRLIRDPPGRITGGDILFQGKSVLGMNEVQMRGLRGNDISMIFQEPMTSLNPLLPCGNQIAEAMELHEGIPRKEALDRATHLLALVGIPEPGQRIREYPYQLSGGMRQRVMIAMALSCNPKLLIADEPTTALDVTIQAQVLELLRSLKEKLGMAIMLITHDLGVISRMAERVVVMYAGKIVEESDVDGLLRDPLHPYTKGLLKSVPRLRGPKGRLHVIPGQVPFPLDLPPGCRFHPRCPYANDLCREHEPEMVGMGGGERMVSCWLSQAVERSGSDA